MLATGTRLGVPTQPMRRVVKGFQLVRSPREYVVRRRAARDLVRSRPSPISFSRDAGFARFAGQDVGGTDRVVEICRKIRADFDHASDDVQTGSKGFLRNLLSTDDLVRYPEIMSFVTNELLLAGISDYLGAVPQLADVKLWSSVPTGREDQSSQLFHRDQEDFRQAKLFLNISDVTETNGPLSLVPASLSDKVAKRLSTPFERTSDEEMFTHCSRDDLVILTGKSGDGAIVDTSRCFHFGSRAASDERLVLVAHYLSYHCVIEATTKTLPPESPLRNGSQKGNDLRALLMRARPTGR